MKNQYLIKSKYNQNLIVGFFQHSPPACKIFVVYEYLIKSRKKPFNFKYFNFRKFSDIPYNIIYSLGYVQPFLVCTVSLIACHHRQKAKMETLVNSQGFADRNIGLYWFICTNK